MTTCKQIDFALFITIVMARKSHDEPEWLTRKTRIDGKLRALGWDIVLFTSAFQPGSADRVAVVEYPTDSGPADYAGQAGSTGPLLVVGVEQHRGGV